MPIAYVRSHGTKTASGTPTVTLAADVPAGRTLLVAVVTSGEPGGDSSNVTGWSRPGTETATWTQIIEEGMVNGSGSLRGRLELWAITTTVTWSSGLLITSTGTAASSIAAASEFSGVGSVLSSASTSRNSNTSESLTVSSTVNLRQGDLAVQLSGVLSNSGATLTPGGTATGIARQIGVSGEAVFTNSMRSTAYEVQTPGTWTTTQTVPSNMARAVIYAGLRAANTAPNAPTLASPVGSVALNRGAVNRFSWVYSDPDTADSQSAADLRYRIVGAGSWTTISLATPNTFYDVAAGTFATGSYEWQVRTYDSLGLVGPYSASSFFSAADAPAGPSITYPVNGQFVERSETLVWSSSSQAAYQVRRVADAAGSPDTGVVYFDTGEVTDAVTRSLALTFATNARTEHVQVRVKNSGLWSPWASVSVNVSYTPPPAPSRSLAVEAATASLVIEITNPAPTGGQPATDYNDVYVDDGDGEERKATGLPTNSTWRYWTPRSGRDYAAAVRVVAVAANGTTTSSS